MANNYDDEFFGFEGIDDDDFLEDDKIDRVLDEIAEIKQTIQGLPDAGVVSGGSEKNIIKPGDIARLIAFRNNPSDISWINGGNN